MHPRTAANLPSFFAPRTLLASAAALLLCPVLFLTAGCQADEPVGHTKTTTKQVIDTPTEKTTVTETHDKDTKLYPR